MGFQGVPIPAFIGSVGAGPVGAGTWVVAQVDPTAIPELGGATLAAGAFGFALLLGLLLVAKGEARIERAVDAHADWSPASVIYGVFAFILVGFMAGYVITQAVRFGITGAPLFATAALAVTGVLALGGYGYAIFGTWLTELEGARRPWVGIVVGSVASGLPWLVLSFWPALFLWGLVAAIGLGSPTRRWVHAERTVEAEQNA